jgi:hypothetical protein
MGSKSKKNRYEFHTIPTVPRTSPPRAIAFRSSKAGFLIGGWRVASRIRMPNSRAGMENTAEAISSNRRALAVVNSDQSWVGFPCASREILTTIPTIHGMQMLDPTLRRSSIFPKIEEPGHFPGGASGAIGGLSFPDERPVPQVSERVIDFLGGVHHKWSVPGYRFVEWLAGSQNESDL